MGCGASKGKAAEAVAEPQEGMVLISREEREALEAAKAAVEEQKLRALEEKETRQKLEAELQNVGQHLKVLEERLEVSANEADNETKKEEEWIRRREEREALLKIVQEGQQQLQERLLAHQREESERLVMQSIREERDKALHHQEELHKKLADVEQVASIKLEQMEMRMKEAEEQTKNTVEILQARTEQLNEALRMTHDTYTIEHQAMTEEMEAEINRLRLRMMQDNQKAMTAVVQMIEEHEEEAPLKPKKAKARISRASMPKGLVTPPLLQNSDAELKPTVQQRRGHRRTRSNTSNGSKQNLSKAPSKGSKASKASKTSSNSRESKESGNGRSRGQSNGARNGGGPPGRKRPKRHNAFLPEDCDQDEDDENTPPFDHHDSNAQPLCKDHQNEFDNAYQTSNGGKGYDPRYDHRYENYRKGRYAGHQSNAMNHLDYVDVLYQACD